MATLKVCEIKVIIIIIIIIIIMEEIRCAI